MINVSKKHLQKKGCGCWSLHSNKTAVMRDSILPGFINMQLVGVYTSLMSFHQRYFRPGGVLLEI